MPRLQNWYQWTSEETTLWQNMTNVHENIKCYGRPCPYHTPSDHHMRTWHPHWRGDRGILERICEHGIGHPDPDQFEFWEQTNQSYQAVHGCDGCCYDNQSDVQED